MVAAAAISLSTSQAPAQVWLVEAPVRPNQNIVDDSVRQAPPAVSLAEVRSNLEAEGYSEVRVRDLIGATYDVQAVRDGRAYTLEVDVLTGQVKSSKPV
jgi:hypothetical protein